jgi:hypothetical protein
MHIAHDKRGVCVSIVVVVCPLPLSGTLRRCYGITRTFA